MSPDDNDRQLELAEVLSALASGRWPEGIPPQGRDDDYVDGIRACLLDAYNHGERLAPVLTRTLEPFAAKTPIDAVAVSRLLSGVTQIAASVRETQPDLARVPAEILQKFDDLRSLRGEAGGLVVQCAKAMIEASDEVPPSILAVLPLDDRDRTELILLALRRRSPDRFLGEAARWADRVPAQSLEDAVTFFLAGDPSGSRAAGLRIRLLQDEQLSPQLTTACGQALQNLKAIGWSAFPSQPSRVRRFGAQPSSAAAAA